MACRTRSSRMPRAATWRSTISARRCANSRSRAARSSFFCNVTKHLLERLQARYGLVVREVEMERGDGDVAVFHGLEVGPFAGMPGRFAAADPVVLPAARIEPLDQTFRVDALPQPGHADAEKGAGREVHVQDDLGIARLIEEPADQLGGERRTGVEREVLAHPRGECDGGNVKQRALEGRGDGAGVGDVVAEV